MIEMFYRRKSCRDFLKVYSEELYKDLIPDIFEIGVLNLLYSFNKLFYTKEELNEIISELKHKIYSNEPEYKTIQKLTLSKPYNYIDDDKKYKFRKYYGNFSSKEDEIYPNWWWDVKDEKNKKNEGIQTNFFYPKTNYQSNYYNDNYNPMMYSSPDIRRDIYFNGYNNYNNNNNYNRINDYNSYYNNNLRYQSINNENEYSRKRMIMNKLTKGKKKKSKKNERKINDNNQNLINPQQNNLPSNRPVKKKISYKITYNKELKPEKIEKSGKNIDSSDTYNKNNNLNFNDNPNNNQNTFNNNENTVNEIQESQNLNFANSQNSNNNLQTQSQNKEMLSSMNISEETKHAVQNNFIESSGSLMNSQMNNNLQNSQNNFNNNDENINQGN